MEKKSKKIDVLWLNKFNLPQSTITFLTTTGLKDEEYFLLTFYCNNDKIDYIIIGDDEGTSIAVEEQNGTVFSVDFTDELPTSYINSSVEAFNKCLELYNQNRNAIANCDDEEITDLLNDIKSKMALIDPATFSDPENWWSEIFEQVEDGLM